MNRFLTLILMTFLCACQTSQIQDAKIYSPCAVIQDFMEQNSGTQSSTLIYVSPKPSPVSQKNFMKSVSRFQSRDKLSVLPETLDYYPKAQTGNVDYSTCQFLSNVYNGPDGADKLRRLRDGYKDKMITPYYNQSFSHIAINPKANQAIFQTSYYCGTLCGGANYIVMERAGGKWVVSSNAWTFVS